MDMTALKRIAFEQMGNRSSHEWKERGNKFYHGERVASLCMELRRLILPGDHSHDEILTAAAWFHDLMNGSDCHAEAGAHKARELLAGYCSDIELEAICSIISVHDDRTRQKAYSEYVQIHQDADLLDHFGTFDIWSSFLCALPNNMTLPDMIDWLVNRRTSETEKYRNELNYDVSRIIYDEKSQFMKDFVKRFSIEGTGGIWRKGEMIQI